MVPAQTLRYGPFVEFGGLSVGFRIVRHFEAITPAAIQGLAELPSSSAFCDYPPPFFERRPMPDMLLVAAAQKSYPVAMFIHFESGYWPMHLSTL